MAAVGVGSALDEFHMQDLVGCPHHLAQNKTKEKSTEGSPALFFTYISEKLVSVRIKVEFISPARGFLLKGVKRNWEDEMKLFRKEWLSHPYSNSSCDPSQWVWSC